MTEQQGFRDEQRALARHWQFLGHACDVAAEGDWIRTVLGGEQVFVQRFGVGLRGFVNRCAHRFHPIRTIDRGNGPVICPFHEWRYDHTGLAYGIPKCREVFGRSPKELNARLTPVEIATAGGLIFGRRGEGPDLADWLGPGRAILEHLKLARPLRYSFSRTVRAHWSLLMQISLDDYHLAGVHPTTFGRHGYLDTNALRYFRFPPHSAYFAAEDAGALERMVAECTAGTWRPDGYRILQFFPNLIVVLVPAPAVLGTRHDYLLVQHLEPLAHDRTRTRTRFFSFPGGGVLRRLLAPFVAAGTWMVAARVHSEDNACVERLQTMARGIEAVPWISAQEVRVGWFDEEYARLLGD